MRVEANGRVAVLSVPAECTSVTIERFVQKNWVPFRTMGIVNAPVTMRVEIAPGTPASGWRAIGHVPARPAKKYPGSFYKGAHSFGPAMAPDGEASGNVSVSTTDGTSAPTANTSATTSTTAVPEESDIWKVDGSTVYFFNQLRGLQVIDLSDPAQPVLQASLRLPATGQDLYVLPDAGGARLAVLLTDSHALVLQDSLDLGWTPANLRVAHRFVHRRHVGVNFFRRSSRFLR